MGLMDIAKQYRLTNATVKTPASSAGPAVVVTASDGNGDSMTPEVWSVHGVWSMPPDNTFGIRLPVGGGNFGAVVATHHYKTPRPTLAKGETAIGSTSADGTSLMASARFYADGKIAVANATKDLLTILNGFVDAVAAGVTVSGGPFNPASIAAINAVKVQLALLLKVPV